jgi:putative ATPase
MEAPLAERIRPQLEDYISQTHLIGPEGSLTQQIAKGIIPSLIFGDQVQGKQPSTNYCTRIATPFFILSAINSGVKDIQ